MYRYVIYSCVDMSMVETRCQLICPPPTISWFCRVLSAIIHYHQFAYLYMLFTDITMHIHTYLYIYTHMNNNIYHILIMCVCWTVCIPAHNKNQSASEFDFPKWSNHLRHRQRGSANVCCCCLVDVIQLEVWGWTRMENWPIPRFALFKCNLSSAAFCHLSHPRDRSYVWFDPLGDQFLLVKPPLLR